MKNRISILFFLFFIINGYAQQPKKGNNNERIIIYDTIMVYDTIVVYDTVKVYDKIFFQNANVIENAVLTIDTASKKKSVSLFFENDTATIPINSIYLSENTKNLDTMKKEILTLLAAIALTQTVKSQDSLNLKSKNNELNPAYTVSVAGIIANGEGGKTSGTFYGINISADNILGKKTKLLLGISADLGPVYIKGINTTTNLGENARGYLGNILFTYRYFSPVIANKLTLYFKTGGGVSLFTNAPQTIGFENIGNETSYGRLHAAIQMEMGIEREVAQGKIYAEGGVLLTGLIFVGVKLGYKFHF